MGANCSLGMEVFSYHDVFIAGQAGSVDIGS